MCTDSSNVDFFRGADRVLRFLALVTLGCLTIKSAMADITVSITDASGKPVYTSELEWWTAQNHTSIQQLRCNRESCSSWRLPVSAENEQIIFVNAIREHAGDSTCFDWLQGSLTLHANLAEYHLSVNPAESVCK